MVREKMEAREYGNLKTGDELVPASRIMTVANNSVRRSRDDVSFATLADIT